MCSPTFPSTQVGDRWVDLANGLLAELNKSQQEANFCCVKATEISEALRLMWNNLTYPDLARTTLAKLSQKSWLLEGSITSHPKVMFFVDWEVVECSSFETDFAFTGLGNLAARVCISDPPLVSCMISSSLPNLCASVPHLQSGSISSDPIIDLLRRLGNIPKALITMPTAE